MSAGLLFTILFAIAALGYIMGRRRAAAASGGDLRTLHSLLGFHGWSVAMATFLAGLAAWVIWNLLMSLTGLPGALNGGFVALFFAAAAFVLSYRRIDGPYRARNFVEKMMLGLLIVASSIAILTTVGIVLSMAFETTRFFQQYSWTEFFFGTTWSPNFRGDSELGMLPLLWGTLYVSFIALLVAVPVGLFTAIYLTEYASKRFRSAAKPAIEILAGIPTIVYGLFALITRSCATGSPHRWDWVKAVRR